MQSSPELTKFLSRITLGDGCWEWQGPKARFGYGKWWYEPKRMLAHRKAWELMRGPIPAGVCVLHKCDNPPCVRPDHLFLGTQADNARDMWQKGRAKRIGPHHKLTQEQADAIRVDPRPSRAVGREYGVTHRMVLLIRRGELWRRGN